jgi:hypothetical protein
VCAHQLQSAAEEHEVCSFWILGVPGLTGGVPLGVSPRGCP